MKKLQHDLESAADSTYASNHRDPHLTVGAGVILGEEEYGIFVKRCHLFANSRSVFSLQSCGFDFMNNRYKGAED
ncbi:MAG: hypothetical protein H6766_03260 [Candidatus Peribacteria bacterium]|nr:MAG: hypothetical protein H6766_03260 [Candidatus Peribacteria bacterium]